MMRHAAPATALLLALGFGLPAAAQTQLPSVMEPGNAPQRTTPGAPAALPGLQGAGQRPVVPPSTPPAAMNPTDALFDAIARGDLAAARDAVRRGANLNERNALGLTPLDAAVDRARPDITFYLLSARGASGMAPEGPPPAAARAPARPAPTRAAPVRAPAPAPVPGLPVRTDGGDPLPEIGFLGFDPRR